jgi:hypothetical protein
VLLGRPVTAFVFGLFTKKTLRTEATPLTKPRSPSVGRPAVRPESPHGLPLRDPCHFFNLHTVFARKSSTDCADVTIGMWQVLEEVLGVPFETKPKLGSARRAGALGVCRRRCGQGRCRERSAELTTLRVRITRVSGCVRRRSEKVRVEPAAAWARLRRLSRAAAPRVYCRGCWCSDFRERASRTAGMLRRTTSAWLPWPGGSTWKTRPSVLHLLRDAFHQRGGTRQTPPAGGQEPHWRLVAAGDEFLEYATGEDDFRERQTCAGERSGATNATIELGFRGTTPSVPVLHR